MSDDKSNVVEFKTRQPQVGEHTFFLCGCDKKEPRPFMPIVIYQNPPVVVGLVCSKCESHLTLVNGVVQMPPKG